MTDTKPSRRRILIRAIAIIGITICLITYVLERVLARQRLQIPLEWARLAPYPDHAVGLSATTSGGMFTRAFRVTFSAPRADIDRWLSESPGTSTVIPDRPASGIRHYAIDPGGGAGYAEVTVDDISGTVIVYVYWS